MGTLAGEGTEVLAQLLQVLLDVLVQCLDLEWCELVPQCLHEVFKVYGVGSSVLCATLLQSLHVAPSATQHEGKEAPGRNRCGAAGVRALQPLC